MSEEEEKKLETLSARKKKLDEEIDKVRRVEERIPFLKVKLEKFTRDRGKEKTSKEKKKITELDNKIRKWEKDLLTVKEKLAADKEERKTIETKWAPLKKKKAEIDEYAEEKAREDKYKIKK